MSKLNHLLILSLAQLLLLGSAKADFQLEMRALSYENPSHRRIDGECCDLTCANQCDTHLDFCLRPPGYSEDEWPEEDCPLGEYKTGGVGGDDITFGDSIGSLDNPLNVPVRGDWMGSFQLLVGVHDDDTFSSDDLVDIIFASPHNLPVGMATTKTYGGQRAHIMLEFLVLCASDFYGPSCSTYCSEGDSDGRYTCDPRTGDKLCRPGFTDPTNDCNTVATEGQLPITTGNTRSAETSTATTPAVDTTTLATATPPTATPPSSTAETTESRPVERTTSSGGVPSTAVTAGIANQGTSKRKNISAIVGPLIAVIIVMVTLVIVVVIFVLWRRKRSKGYRQDQLTERMLDAQTGVDGGIPNATYNPSAVGVVYTNRKGGVYEERNFDNPIYHSVSLNSSRVGGAMANGGPGQGASDTMSSSGLYSTIDNRSPRRSWALRPPGENPGQYSVITNPP